MIAYTYKYAEKSWTSYFGVRRYKPGPNKH